MALYTLKSEDEAMNPELYKNRVQGFAGLGANSPELQLFNMFGRNSGGGSQPDDNFFAKKGKSIENALGTTGAFIAGGVDVGREDDLNKKRQEDAKKSIEDIIKSHGYNSKDEFYDASDKAEREIFGKYGFDSDDYWNKHAEMWSPAKANDKDVLDLEATRQDVINRMSQEDADTIRKFDSIQDEIKGQSKKNADIADKAAKDWKDYRENSYIGQKTNQDRGKFLGSAINTLSTASDVMLPGAGVVFNTVQGGVEGIADELEQNGLKNFDWNRAGQNALSGALTGAVVGGVNKGINNALAKRGGNLLKGGNKLTRAINNFNANNPIGQIGSTLASGATRGAVSGAVGGATGAGLGAAMNGQDVLGSALQGAVRGAQQGATTGGIMAGVNMAASKTPGVGDTMRQLNEAGEDWNNRKAQGQDFKQRLGETWDESTTKRVADKVGQRLGEDWDAVKGGFKNVREGLGVLNERGLLPSPGMTIKDVSGGGFDDAMQTAGVQTTTEMRNPSLTVTDENIQDPSTELYRRFTNQGDTNNSAKWDDLAKEYGFSNYEDATNRFAQANPGTDATTENVLDWMDATKVIVPAQETVPSKTSKEAKWRRAKGQELLSQYGTVDQPTARSTRAVDSLLEIANAGFTRPEDVERMANVITGSNGQVSKLVDNLVKSAKPVNTFDGVDGKSLTDFIDEKIKLNSLGGTNAGKAVKETINANLQSLPSHNEGSITYEDAPENVFKVIQNLEASAAELEGRGGSTYHRPTTKDLHQAKVIKSTADLLKERLFNGADVKQALTPEVANSLKAYDPENKAFADYVDNTIMGAKNISDLRKAQAPWVRMSKYIDNAYVQSATAGGRVAANAGDLTKILTSKNGLLKSSIDAIWNSNTAKRARANIYDKMADRSAAKEAGNATQNFTSQSATTLPTDSSMAEPQLQAQLPSNPVSSTTATAPQDYNPSTRLYNAIGRTEGLTNAEQARNADYLANIAQEAEIIPNITAQNAMMPTEMTAQPTASTALYNSVGNGNQMQANTMANQTNAQSGNKYFPTTGDYWSDMIGDALSRAIDNDDVTAFAALFPMYKEAMSNVSKQSTKTSESSTAGKKLTTTQQRANAAMNSLERISNMEPDLGYNLSGIPVIGNIATLGGNDYEAEAKSLAQQIGYMVSGANIKEEEAYNIGKAYVPQPFDSESTRRNKLQRAYEVIQQYQNGYAEE